MQVELPLCVRIVLVGNDYSYNKAKLVLARSGLDFHNVDLNHHEHFRETSMRFDDAQVRLQIFDTTGLCVACNSTVV